MGSDPRLIGADRFPVYAKFLREFDSIIQSKGATERAEALNGWVPIVVKNTTGIFPNGLGDCFQRFTGAATLRVGTLRLYAEPTATDYVRTGFGWCSERR